MNYSERIHSLLNVRKEEANLIVKILLFSFCIGLGLAFLFQTANVLYLSKIGTDTLPYAYVIISVILLLAEVLYSYLEPRIKVKNIMLFSFGFVLFCLLVFLFLLNQFQTDAVLFALIITNKVASLLANSELGKLNAILFDIRQSKRLFGLLSSASIPAYVIGLYSSHWLLNYITIENQLILAIIAFIVGLFIFSKIYKTNKERLNKVISERSEKSKKNKNHNGLIRRFFTNRYIFFLCLFVFTITSISVLIEFDFLVESNYSFEDQKSLSYFFGIFFSLSYFLIFFLKISVYGRLVSRFGLQTTLMLLPVGLLVIISLVVSSRFILDLDINYIALIWGLMMYNEIFKSSFNDPAFFVLFQPLTTKNRIPAYNKAGILENSAFGAAGSIVLLLQWIGEEFQVSQSEQYINIFIILALVVFMFLLVYVSKSYKNTVEKALKDRKLGNQALSLKDAASLDILKKKIQGHHTGEVLYAMDLLYQMNFTDLKKYLNAILNRKDKESKSVKDLKLETIKFIQKNKINSMQPTILSLLPLEKDNELLACLIECYTTIGYDDLYDEVINYLDSEIVTIRMAAITGLIRSGGIIGVVKAGQVLLNLVASSDDGERKLGSKIIGAVGVKNFYQLLLTLITDSNTQVRIAAINAAASVKNPKLIPRILDLIHLPGTFESASRAIIAMKDESVPYIKRQFSITKSSEELKLRRMVHILARINTPESLKVLWSEITNTNYAVFKHVVEALYQVSFQASRTQSHYCINLIENHVQQAHMICYELMNLKKIEEKGSLGYYEHFYHAMQQEYKECTQRILFILSFAFDKKSMSKVIYNMKENTNARSTAIELLDNLLPTKLKKKILPLFDDMSVEERYVLLSQFQSQRVVQNKYDITSVIKDKEFHFCNSWTHSIALHSFISQNPHTNNLNIFTSILAGIYSELPLMRNTSLWALDQVWDDFKGNEFINIFSNNELETIYQGLQDMRAYQTSESKLFLVEKVLLLKTIKMFSNTTEEVIAEIASIADEVYVDIGDSIVEKGEEGDCMYIIYQGQVRVHDGSTVFAKLKDRDFFGEFSLLDSIPRSASVTAETDVVLLKLDQTTFYEIMSDRIEIVRGVLQNFVSRLTTQNNKIFKLENQIKQSSPVQLSTGKSIEELAYGYYQVKEKIFNELDEKLSKDLYYHGPHHTKDVLEASIRLAELEKIGQEDTLLIKTAAVLHDLGFINVYKEHEQEGIRLSKEILPEYGYSPEQIEKICGMIAATKVPQNPKNHLEKIICDADLDYLGRSDFSPISDTLFEELKARGIVEEVDKWNQMQLKFLNSHTYFTSSSIKTRNKNKLNRILEIEELL